jgi:hypothetical protein
MALSTISSWPFDAAICCPALTGGTARKAAKYSVNQKFIKAIV